MRTVTAAWAQTIVKGVQEPLCIVHGYMHGEATFEIPVIDGQIVYDISARGMRRLSLTVPLIGPDGFNWDPGTNPFHPLATYGQRIRVQLGVKHADDTPELLLMGFFLVAGTNVDTDAGVVQVVGADLIELVTESKILLQPDSVLPLPTDTHLTAIDKLMYPALHSPTLGDLKILGTSFATMPVFAVGGTTLIRDGEERLPLIQKIAEAWGARFYVNDTASLRFEPFITDVKPVPDATITAGTITSTLIGQGHRQDRKRAYNSVRVTSLDSATGNPRGAALRYVTSGALDVHGAYGWVTHWYQSPYAIDNAAAATIANNLLKQGTLMTLTEHITCAPNAAIQIGDTVKVIGETTTFTGIVAAMSIGLTAGSGPMTLDVTNDIGSL